MANAAVSGFIAHQNRLSPGIEARLAQEVKGALRVSESTQAALSMCLGLITDCSFLKMGWWNFPFYKEGTIHPYLMAGVRMITPITISLACLWCAVQIAMAVKQWMLL